MSHYIEELTVQNFKSCKDMSVSMTPFTPMVGYNNAGKSNILEAVEWLLKDKLLSSEYYNNKTESIVIEGIISGVTEDVLQRLNEQHQEPLRPYILNDQVRIKRSQPANASKKSEIKLEIYNFASQGYQNNPRGIWNAIKAMFPEPIKIGAMENAGDDAAKAKTTSTIGKLLKELCNSLTDNHATVVNRHLVVVE